MVLKKTNAENENKSKEFRITIYYNIQLHKTRSDVLVLIFTRYTAAQWMSVFEMLYDIMNSYCNNYSNNACINNW